MSPSSSPWKGSSPPHWVSAGGRVRWSERNSRKKGCRHTNLSLRKEELSVLAETRGQHPEKRLWLGTLWQDWGCWSGDKCLLGHKDPWVVQWRDQIPVISSCTTNNLKSQHLENCLSHFLTGLNCVVVIWDSVFLLETHGGLVVSDIIEGSLSGGWGYGVYGLSAQAGEGTSTRGLSVALSLMAWNWGNHT
jgi:hypothetical protein